MTTSKPATKPSHALASAKRKQTKAPVRERGKLRVERIIASTIKLLAKSELNELTIVAIAAHAKIGRSSVYEYFPTISEVIRVIAERYAAEVVQSTSDLLVKLNSHDLTEIVDTLIDGTIFFFNTRPAAAKIHLGSDASFSLRVMINDFPRSGAGVYHEWYTPGWSMKPMAEDDPFYMLSALQYALFSESVRRHGKITDYYRQQTKLIAHAYLSHYTPAISPLPAAHSGSAQVANQKGGAKRSERNRKPVTASTQ